MNEEFDIDTVTLIIYLTYWFDLSMRLNFSLRNKKLSVNRSKRNRRIHEHINPLLIHYAQR